MGGGQICLPPVVVSISENNHLTDYQTLLQIKHLKSFLLGYNDVTFNLYKIIES